MEEQQKYSIPYDFEPTWYMLEVLKHPARFQVLDWHRKARKTSLAINQLIRWAVAVPGTYWYISPSYSNAKRTVWDDLYMLPKYVPEWSNGNSTFIKKKETELKIEFLHNGSQIYVLGADRPDLMRGANPKGVILDEFAIMKKEVWDDVIQPIMRANPHAWAWFLFTPRGKNHAFEMYQRGQDPKHPEWKSWKLDVYHSGIMNADQIENARQTMSPASFNQELMGEFLEGEGSVFRGIREAATAVPESPKEGKSYVMGVDLAKLQDFTVIAVYDRHTNKQVYQDRFHHLDWNYQKAKIREISRHYNGAQVVMDGTGIGDPIVDDMLRSGIPVTSVKLTNQSKMELIEKLSIWIEQKKVSFIPLEETIFEFDNYGYEMTKTGKVSYSAPNGMNDDIVIAHALAVSELFPVNRNDVRTTTSPIRQALIKRMNPIGTFEEQYSEWESN